MTIGVSLLLVAVGAILIWGVTGEASGIDVDAIGVILIVVGILGFVLSLIFWDRWGWGGPVRRRATYVEGDPAVRRTYAEPVERRRVVEEEVDPGPPAPPPPP
jgi:hypothetical protein